MRKRFIPILASLLLFIMQVPVQAAEPSPEIHLEDPVLQDHLSTYVSKCEHQSYQKITLKLVSDCLEKNNGIMTLGNSLPFSYHYSFKGIEQLASLPIKELNIDTGHPTSSKLVDFGPLLSLKSLEGLQLTGEFAEDFSPLAQLPNLKKLSINSLTNKPFLTLSLLKNLKELNISGPQNLSLTGIENMPQLRSLSSGNIMDYDSLSKAPQLTNLFICFSGENTRFLRSLPNLESLIFYSGSTNPKSISSQDLEGLTKLKSLKLSSVKVDDYHFLNKMPEIEKLSLRDSEGAFQLLKDLTSPLEHLKELVLFDDSIVNINGAERISTFMPALEKLDLGWNKIYNLSPLVETTTPYQNLKELNLRYNRVSNINLLGEHANLFPALETLDAEGNYISSVMGIPKLPALNTFLSEFNLINLKENPPKYVGRNQYVLDPYRPFPLKMGRVLRADYYMRNVDSPTSIERIDPNDLIIQSSNPEIVEILEDGSMFAKSPGTATISYSIIGSNDPNLTKSFEAEVVDEYYKPFEPSFWQDVTVHSTGISLNRGYWGDDFVVAANGEIISRAPAKNGYIPLPSLEGIQELQIWAESKLGVKSDVLIREVYKSEKPQMPKIDMITDQSEYITGTADPNTTIIITPDKEDGIFVGASQKVGEDGRFKVYTGKLPVGYELHFKSVNDDGRESGTYGTSVYDKTPPPVPVFNQVTNLSSSISGKTEPFAEVVLYWNSKRYSSYTANSTGNFEISLGRLHPKAGDIFTATAQDKYKNISSEAKIVALDGNPPAAPTIDTVTSISKLISGKSQPNTTVLLYLQGKLIGSVKADSKGIYKYTITPPKPGAVVTSYAKSPLGKLSGATRRTVLDKTPPAPPKVGRVSSKTTVLTGNAEANSVLTVKIGSKTLGTQKVNAKGVFSLKIKAQKSGTVLKFVSIDSAGNISKTVSVTVAR